MRKPTTTKKVITVCPLYQMVFSSHLVKMVVFVLLTVSVVQPLTPVFAAETEAAEEVPVSVADEVEIVEETPSEPEVEEIVEETPSEPEAEAVVETLQTAPPAEAGSGDQVGTTSVTTTESDSVGDSSQAGETATSTASSTSELSTEVNDNTSSAPQDSYDTNTAKAASETASSTDVATPLTNTVVTDDNFYQFSKDECVRVADGSFYCGSGGSQTVVVEDSFYVALDGDGDTEIFARIDGETIQVTNNTVADAAPYYDVISNTLVWHQEVNERYQIMSYDFDTEKTAQLTSGRVNNMQPNRYGDVTVWQQWGSQSWEIVMHDGDTVTALTDDVYPDISPTVREEYVMWRTQYADSQTVTIYDRNTKKREVIDDVDPALALSNPRLMLVFEGINEAGERITSGFDPVTGKVVPLSTDAAPLPENIPDSEPTKEVRALIQPKPTTEDNFDADEDDRQSASSSPPVAHDEVVATSTTDVIVPAFVSSSTPQTIPVEDMSASSSPEIAIPDLVIPPATSTESF